MNVLEVDGLAKSFGAKQVVKGVRFEVGESRIVGLLGPNGAGKSTCFKMTCGLIVPDRGRVILNGADVTRWPLHRRAREGRMGYLAQEQCIFARLTVEQNLLGLMEMLGMGGRERRDRCEELLDSFGLTEHRRKQARRLSGGLRRRLEIAGCLVNRPNIVMLDEPFAGVDPVTVQQLQRYICMLRDQGISIWITDHAAHAILEITDYTYVVMDGLVEVEGPPAQIRNHPKVIEQYLGESSPAQGGPAPGRRPQEPRPTEESPADARGWRKRIFGRHERGHHGSEESEVAPASSRVASRRVDAPAAPVEPRREEVPVPAAKSAAAAEEAKRKFDLRIDSAETDAVQTRVRRNLLARQSVHEQETLEEDEGNW
ncbi:MAG TPA: LPS export ABC transporter ATP-binding protein [Pirellulaceae bacterium]|jgi:lipopolysaccharide export system ATP-binding protein|nr:LPS export ABC transporter ATP-binding protein [Pirellulaceae bacterium]